jgi:hypothetical protein
VVSGRLKQREGDHLGISVAFVSLFTISKRRVVVSLEFYVTPRCFCFLHMVSVNLIFNLHTGGWNQGPLDTAAT